MTSRDYYINFSIEPVDKEANEYGFGFGSRVTIEADNEDRVSDWSEMIKDSLLWARKNEREYQRKRATHFWKRWLGA